MQATIALDDTLFEKARDYSGLSEQSEIVNAGLRALIEREAGRRLAALGGTMPDLEPIPR